MQIVIVGGDENNRYLMAALAKFWGLKCQIVVPNNKGFEEVSKKRTK